MVTKLFNLIGILFFVFSSSGVNAREIKSDKILKTHYQGIAEAYDEYGIKNTVYLAYRDIPSLMNEFLGVGLNDKFRALDYGCGTGRSTRLIKRISPNAIVEGVDIDSAMLKLAIKKDKSGIYKKVKDSKLPHRDATFDFVFSSFAVLDMSSKEYIKKAMLEIRRVLKPNGVFILVTASEAMFNPKYEWISLQNDFKENQELTSGKLVTIKVINSNMTFYDYYWTEKDYESIFNQAKLHVLLKHKPVGNQEDEVNWKWKSEKNTSPYLVYVLKK